MTNIKKTLIKYYKNPPTIKGASHRNFFPLSINKPQGEFLARFIQEIKPKYVIEVGLGLGMSTLWIESGRSRPEKHIVIDPYQKAYRNKGKLLIKQAKLKKDTLVEETSQEYLASLLKKQGGKVDMFFLDGDERFDGFTTDMYFATKLLKVGGFIVARNTWNPSVRKSLMFFIKNLPYYIYSLSNLEQVIIKRFPLLGEVYLRGVCRLRFQSFCILEKKEEDEREWNHFVSF